VEVIADATEQKGTGRWTVQIALELGVPVGTIAASVFARSTSGHTSLREAAAGTLLGPDGGEAAAVEPLIDDVRRALWASKVVAYAQGFDMIQTASDSFGWDVDLAAVARIWRGGCIIRARLLERIRQAYAVDGLPNLLVDPSLVEELGQVQDGWRRVVAHATLAGIPVTGFAEALGAYDSARRERLPAALLQGLRDYFGAHSYRRIDREGSFHTNWSTDRTEQEV